MSVLTDFVVGLVVSTVGAFLNGWFLMIAVGVAHHEWLPGLPTLGYLWAVMLVALLRGVFSLPDYKRGES